MWEHLPTELREVVLKQLFVPDSTGFIEPRHWTCVCNHHFLRAAAASSAVGVVPAPAPCAPTAETLAAAPRHRRAVAATGSATEARSDNQGTSGHQGSGTRHRVSGQRRQNAATQNLII